MVDICAPPNAAPAGGSDHTEDRLDFLGGGGEMGALIRAHDWSSSSLGDPRTWPQALRTAVRLILNTGHPMYIWWGEDLACLYNDAYRSLIGPERHPGSLGRPGREVWDEIWDIVGPQIEQVMSGRGATWNVDHLVPITRDGQLEEVYWTYSYSPIDDTAAPDGVGGVLVVCTETTENVLAEQRLQALVERQRRLFEQAPGFIAVLRGPEHEFEFVNLAYQKLAGDRGFIGRTVREVFPDLDGQGYFDLLDRVFTTGERFIARRAAMRLNSSSGEPPEERFLDFIYEPVIDERGEVSGVFVEGHDVTEQMQLEASLRESEARFRALVDTVPAFVWFATPSGEIEYLNDRWFEYTGLPRGESISAGWASAIHPDDVDHTLLEWERARAAGTTYEAECRYRRKDGTYRWHLVRAEPVRDDKEDVVRWFGTSTDFHDRKETAERIEMALDAGAIMGTWVLEIRENIVVAGDRFANLFGVDPEECRKGIPLQPVLDAILEDDRARVAAEIAETVATGGRYRTEYRIGTSTSDCQWVEAIGRVEYSASGEASRFAGLLIDIGARRKAEAERDRANALLRAFVDSVPGAIFAKDRDGRILIGNRDFAETIGHKPEEFLGKTDLELLPDKEQARRLMENDRTVMASDRLEQVEEELTLPDGRKSFWISTKAPFRDASGEVIGLIGSSVDITQRREAEEREHLLAREIDHRSKNLLGVVQSLMNLTRAPTIDEFRHSVTGRVHALARAHSLLAASRWEGVDLRTLVQDELAAYSGPGTSRVEVEGPPLRLRPAASQALAMTLHELATNAVKHGAFSVKDGKVSVTWRENHDTSESVFQLRWIERHSKGVEPPRRGGFGSTVIQGSIKEQLGGTLNMTWHREGLECVIQVSSDKIIAWRARDETDVPVVTPRPTEPVTLSGSRVLVVEDEALVAMDLQGLLESWGCVVIGPAATVERALDLIRTEAPDLAVLDANLAGDSSEPAARALAALEIPFVLCTGYASGGRESSWTSRALLRVNKPFVPEELERKLKASLADQSSTQ